MKNQPYLTVAGFGVTEINGRYDLFNILNGKPQYFFGAHQIYWDVSVWKIMLNGTGTVYVSSQDVATPDLITSWDIYISTPPAGTITASIDPQTIDEAYLAKRTLLANDEAFVLIADGTSNPYLNTVNNSLMRGIYLDRKRLGYENIDVGTSTSAFFYNKGIYNKIEQTGNVTLTTKPQTFGLTSTMFENENYSTINNSSVTQFGSNHIQFGMSNVISHTGTWQPTDDFAIGSNLNQRGLYNYLISSPIVSNTKVNLTQTGIENIISGNPQVGAGTNYLTINATGMICSVGTQAGSTPAALTRKGGQFATHGFDGTNYAIYASAQSTTSGGALPPTNYAVWASATGAAAGKNWAFWSNAGNNFLGNDNTKTYFGTGIDASMYYDGTDLVFNPRDAGTGVVKSLYAHKVQGVTLGAEKLTNGTFTGSAASWTVPAGSSYNTNAIRKTANGLDPLTQPIANMVTPLVAGEWMTLTYVVSSRTVSGVTPKCGGVTLTARSANGTYTETFRVIDPTDPLQFTPLLTTARYYLDTISLKSTTDGNLAVDGTSDLYGNVYAYKDLEISDTTK